MHRVSAVTICEVKPSIIEKGKVRWHEAVASPYLFRICVLPFRINTGLHRRIFLPHDFAIKRHFGKGLQHLVAGHIEKFAVSFLPHFEPVASALKLISKRFDEVPILIKNENRRMILLRMIALMNHIETVLTVDRNVVSDLPGVFVRKVRPAVNHLILMFPFPDYDSASGARRRFATRDEIQAS